MSVREGCRPMSCWMIAAACSPISGRRATTTRFITLVRARDVAFLDAGRPSRSSFGMLQIRASSRSISSMLWARDDQRRAGSPGTWARRA